MSKKRNGLFIRVWRSRVVQSLISDGMFYRIKYWVFTRKRLNLDNPKTFNEKIQWLKLYDRKESYKMMADKFEVRHYVKKMLGEEYLVPLYGVYDSFGEIDFDQLPNQFVLKPNHTSGDIFVCTDKAMIDMELLEEKIEGWLRRDYYPVQREWPYKGIRPRIVCEKLLADDSGVELKDYKFMCFRGDVNGVFVCSERNSPTGLKVDYYNLDWELQPFLRHYPNSGKPMIKPKTFDKMVAFASILSKDLPFGRIDFYESEGRLYFGEITFYPGSGFEEFTPDCYDDIFGAYLRVDD